jgi:hypothetical protein
MLSVVAPSIEESDCDKHSSLFLKRVKLHKKGFMNCVENFKN